jgi:hypothetical protein
MQIPSSPRPRVEFKKDSYPVDIHLPRLHDPLHPDGCEAFNHDVLERAMKAAGDAEPLSDREGWLNVSGTTVSDGNLAGVVLSYDSYSGGAHPNSGLETLLYDGERGRTVALSDLFTDKRDSLERLSSEVGAVLKSQPDVDEGFIANCTGPAAYNFAAFEPSPEGLKFMLPAARSGPYGPGCSRPGWGGTAFVRFSIPTVRCGASLPPSPGTPCRPRKARPPAPLSSGSCRSALPTSTGPIRRGRRGPEKRPRTSLRSPPG